MSLLGDLLWKMLPWQLRQAQCTHFQDAVYVDSDNVEGCEECLKMGGEWAHLRRCMICGKVGCCNESPNVHAAKHFEETGHPIVRSVEPGEQWGWCYPDQVMTPNVGASG